MDWQLIAIIAGCLAIGVLIGRGFGGGGSNAAPSRPSMPPPAATGAGGPHEVRIENGGPNKIATIKALRGFLPLSLKEAKDLVDAAPAGLVRNLSRADAETLARLLNDSGATTTIR